MSGFLTKKQIKELKQELKLERSRRYAERLKTILLLNDGQKYADIAKFLFLNISTVSNYKNRYIDFGIDGLINDDYVNKKSKLSGKDIERLKEQLSLRIFARTQDVILFIKKEFGVEYTRGGVTDLLHRIGFSYKKATPVPGKAKRSEQKKFVRRYKGIKPHGPVYFGDAVHPEYGPTITHGWIQTGKRFEVKTTSGWKKRVNICAVIEINTHKVISRSFKTINKDAICSLLRCIRSDHPDMNEKVYLVLDGAGYNKAKKVRRLAKALNIKIVYLPPYSPNLNPIERLWKFMKKKVTANKYYEHYDDFKHALTSFFRGIRKYINDLRTLITDNFPILGS